MFNLQAIETRIKQSDWWHRAAVTIDSHHCNTSGVMLTHHLQCVYDNVDTIFRQPGTGFYGELFALIRQLDLDKASMEKELKVVALLHDIGKIDEDKLILIDHPLTGKPAHKRHGLVSLKAAMEIFDGDFGGMQASSNHVFRTIELHDMSYGLYREHQVTNLLPERERWNKINDKIYKKPAAGLLYLLIFKLADIHGHENISDVLWFYNTVKAGYFDPLQIPLPLPTEADIR